MMNSIRPDALASLLLKGEAKNENRSAKEEADIFATYPWRAQ
jgi:hypothetical protein